MEYVKGVSLSTHLKNEKHITEEIAKKILALFIDGFKEFGFFPL